MTKNKRPSREKNTINSKMVFFTAVIFPLYIKFVDKILSIYENFLSDLKIPKLWIDIIISITLLIIILGLVKIANRN